MLTDLRIQNFKAWRDTGSLRLAPLTVLFGSNSSGKSSLHQLLLMLRQTVESPDRRRVLHFGDQSTPVDLGAFIDVAPGHDVREPLDFALQWRPPKPLEVTDVKTGCIYTGVDLTFSAQLKALQPKLPRLAVQSMEYALSGGENPMRLGLRRNTKGEYVVNAEGFHAVRTLGRKWPVSAPTHFHGFPDDINTRFQNLEFAADLTLALEQELTSMAYLGPLRERPERLYRWSGEEPDHVGWRGERAIEALLAGADRRFQAMPGSHYKPMQVVVANWLKRLGVIDDFAVRAIREGGDQYEVRVRSPQRRTEVLLTDVGFGVSQVLPVLVQCFYAPRDSVLILEQPEIHLHPGVQAGLADLFIDALRIREDGAQRNLQLIVESHSEHLLRRLMRRIAENKIPLDDVALYFVRPGPRGSHIAPLEVDEDGTIRNWPDDFFGDQMSDIAAQADRAMQRRLGARG